VFSADALHLLTEAAGKTKKYKITWKDGKAVRKFAQRLVAPGIRKILDEHYFDHPVVKVTLSRKDSVRRTLRREAEGIEVDLEAAEWTLLSALRFLKAALLLTGLNNISSRSR
jgi:hypothetical protein